MEKETMEVVEVVEASEDLAQGTGNMPVKVDAMVVPVATPEKAGAAVEEYQAICDAMLDNTDYQTISGKKFRKKSGWRKLALAYGVSDEIVETINEFDENKRIIFSMVRARATAANGRTTENIGVCDLFEKCSYKCAETCDGTKHFSNPQHDIPATAATRAINRAFSDLFGLGEVSAEEMNYQNSQRARSQSASKPGKEPGLPKDELYALAKKAKEVGLLQWMEDNDLKSKEKWPWDKKTCEIVQAKIDKQLIKDDEVTYFCSECGELDEPCEHDDCAELL